MSRIVMQPFATAEGQARTLLARVEKALGVTPNMMRAMANSPAVLDAYLQFSGALSKGSLPGRVNTLIALTAAVLSAIVAISIKVLSRTERPDAIVIWTTLLWVPMSLLPALFVWTGPSGITWLWVVAAGFFGTAGHMFWTRALKRADASLLTPISFMQVPFVALLAWWLFAEAVTLWTAVGAAIIFAANAYIAHREARLASRTVTDREIGPETQRR